MKKLILSAGMLVVLVGCTSATSGGSRPTMIPPVSGPVEFLADRWYDFADLWGGNFSASKDQLPGLQLKVYPTKVFQIGFDILNPVERAGFEGRALGVWEEKRIGGLASFFYTTDVYKRIIAGNMFMNDRKQEYIAKSNTDIVLNDDRDWLTVGFSFHLLTFGMQFHYRTIETFDFIFGWFNVDFMYDDHYNYNVTKKQQQAVGEATSANE